MQLIQVEHQTTYTFDQAVTLRPHRLLLRPRDGFDLRIRTSGLQITPKASLYWQRDAFNNSVAIAVFDRPTTRLNIVSTLTLEQYQSDVMSEDHLLPSDPENAELQAPEDLLKVYRQTPSKPDGVPQTWIRALFGAQNAGAQFAALKTLCDDIKSTMTYQTRESPGVQTMAQTLALSSGSCRDLAWFLIEVVRACGLPARFVTGYLLSHQFAPEDGATHAWAEVFLEDYGWIGFDPTVGRPVGAQHLAVAVANDPKYIPPVSGAYRAAPNTQAELTVKVRVEACSAD